MSLHVDLASDFRIWTQYTAGVSRCHFESRVFFTFLITLVLQKEVRRRIDRASTGNDGKPVTGATACS